MQGVADDSQPLAVDGHSQVYVLNGNLTRYTSTGANAVIVPASSPYLPMEWVAAL